MKATLALVVWSLTIAVVCLIPIQSQGLELIPHQDKLIHAFCYAVLAGLISWVLSSKTFISNSQKRLFWAILSASIYGFFIECLQAVLNTGRHFDYFDIIANIIGSLIGSLLYNQIRKNKSLWAI